MIESDRIAFENAFHYLLESCGITCKNYYSEKRLSAPKLKGPNIFQVGTPGSELQALITSYPWPD